MCAHKATDFNVPDLRKAYRMNWGTVSYFRPMIAKYIYTIYKSKRVVDFCAGWGGRMIGALATPGIVSYTGIDTNVELRQAYADMANLMRQNGSSSVCVKMLISPAERVDFAKLRPFDTVLTSPPYWGIEKYEHMPAYKTRDDWLHRFMGPVLKRVTDNIDVTGKVIINIRQEFTEQWIINRMEKLGWPLKETLHMNASTLPGRGSKSGKRQNSEPIYVFRRKRSR